MNQGQNFRFKVIDNFTLGASGILLESARAAGFGAWKPNKGEVGSSIYEGMSFHAEHSIGIAAITRTIGCPILPNSMFVRHTNPSMERAYVHSDRSSGDFTCVLYLTEHEDEHGTGFFRHRKTGLEDMPTLGEMHDNPDFEEFKRNMVEPDEKDWQMTSFVSGKVDRAVIFSAPMLHARIPLLGIGNGPEDSRFVWVCHFNI